MKKIRYSENYNQKLLSIGRHLIMRWPWTSFERQCQFGVIIGFDGIRNSYFTKNQGT